MILINNFIYIIYYFNLNISLFFFSSKGVENVDFGKEGEEGKE